MQQLNSVSDRKGAFALWLFNGEDQWMFINRLTGETGKDAKKD